ncbi:DUF819 family protein [Myxococcota bacterium]|nr:DUF819 family protein [Myxococcota bacterium]
MSTLIGADDAWGLVAVLVGWAALSIHLEQRYKWAASVSGCVLALGGGLFFANVGLVPTDSAVYDGVWSYVVPLAVPLLLFDADVRRIWRESGRAFGAFHVAALGTILGATIATALLARWLPDPPGLSAMFSATYVGGSVNFVAMTEAFRVAPDVVNAALVADNLVMALFFGLLASLPRVAWLKRAFPTPHEDALAAKGAGAGENRAAAYWGRTEMSLRDLAAALAVAIVVVAISIRLAALVQASALPELLRGLLGQKYLIITALTVLLASVFPRFFASIRGARELGTLGIYVFFVVIGVPASLMAVLTKSPILLLYAAIILSVNVLVTLGLGKLLKHDLEVLVIASNATSGGPTTAAAMAISKGWDKLVLPALLTGVWGYVIGNYLGYYLGTTVAKILG